MKQRRGLRPVLLLLLLAISIILWKSPASAPLAAMDPAPVRPSLQVHEPVISAAASGAEPAEEAATDAVAETDSDLALLVESVDVMSPLAIQRAVKRLRSYPPAQVSNFFLKSLKAIGSKRPAERDRLIMIANSLQSKTDLPFWTDLAKRQTPRYTNEETLRNPAHPTLESRFVDVEQLQAIRNIGLLARDNREARKVLMEIILTPDASAHRTLHREEAYITLKEADLAASLRCLKQLAADDDLLKRL